MLFQDVPIRGAYFRGRDIQNAVNEMEAGERLTFEREPENAHDGNAIKALIDGIHIGYVGREFAGWMAPHMDKGTSFVGVVTSMQEAARGNMEPWATIGTPEVIEEMFPTKAALEGEPLHQDDLPGQ